MLAMMADNIEHVISYWIIFQKFESPALGGFAVFSHWVPFLLFSVYAGALADRFDPRRIIQLGMLLFMAVSLGWGILFLTDSLEMWHAVVLLVVHGLAGVIWAPAAQLLVHDIVGPAQLQSAVRMIASGRTLGVLLGPAVGGGLMLAFGPAWGILLNIFIYLPLTLWLWKAPYGPAFRAGPRTPGRAISGLADILETLRSIASDRTIVSMIMLAGCASFLVGNAHQAQMPEFSRDLGHDGGLHYSALLAATAAGALLAGIVLESRGLLARACEDRLHPGPAVVRHDRGLRLRDELSAGAGAAVRRGVSRSFLQLDGDDPGPAQRAPRDPRPGGGALQHVLAGAALLQRNHRRARRQPDRNPLVAGAERRRAADRDDRAAVPDAGRRAARLRARRDAGTAGPRGPWLCLIVWPPVIRLHFRLSLGFRRPRRHHPCAGPRARARIERTKPRDDETMDVTVERNDDVLSLGVKGRIDYTTAPAFDEAVEDAMAETDRALILDFGELAFIGSAGLRVLLVKAKALQARDVKLVLCALSDPVRQVFQITGFERILQIHADLGEARASLDA